MSRVKSFLARRMKSFKYAFNGLNFVFKTQINFKIHLVAAIFAIVSGIWLKINYFEWLILIIVIFFVLIAETFNTVVEKIMDYINPDFDEKIGIIKDLAAAAVLLAAILSIIVGLIIFLPKLLQLIF